MTTRTATFKSAAEYATHDFEAETPQQALALARQFYADETTELWFDRYAEMPVNEIAVCDVDGNNVALWLNDDLRLRLAARDLLDALQALYDLPADDAGERIIPAGFLDQARAAIAKAKGEP
jgi:hypothetical protein